MNGNELTYDDFLQRLTIQDVLIDAGYRLNRRDGLRYPSYVRTDGDGRRVRGDKFIVTANGQCCFQPPQQKLYNIISFIKEHPQFFAEYRSGISGDRLVNLVCNRLLNHPIENRDTRIIQPRRDIRPFSIDDYDIHKFNPQDRASQKKFYFFFSTGASTCIHSMPSTGTSAWRPGTVRTARATPTSLFRSACPRTRTGLSGSRNGDGPGWTEAAVTRARRKEAIRVKDCG